MIFLSKEELTMGILKRFSDIMSANINALLDKAEDPEKMIDEYLRDMRSDYQQVKSETAVVLAQAKNASREVVECEQEIANLTEYAKKAVKDNNDSDAKIFLAKKVQSQAKLESLKKEAAIFDQNAAKMRQMHDKLFGDIQMLEQKREMLKSKLKMAKTQEKMADMAGKYAASTSLESFESIEDRINQEVAKAEALAELSSSTQDSDVETLKEKYQDTKVDQDVDDELAALKKEMGIQ